MLFLLLLFSHLWLGSPAGPYPVDYVIVLMMENRSFDNLLGFLKRDLPDLDGLNGNETQPFNTSDPNSKTIQVNENGFDTGPDDPCHSFDCITEQVYGFAKPVDVSAEPKMNGFVQNAIEQGHTNYNPVSMFNTTALPILTTLAQEFVVFDKWFCSGPTPTNPNRAFVMSGTAHGMTNNDIPTNGYPQQTHFEQIANGGKTWKIYFSDDPWAALYFHNLRLPENLQYITPIEQFYIDVKSGNLPSYSFLQPRPSSGPNGPANWQHPDDSVREGERLIKQVYETLRNSPLWERLVFVITYDEHGGFYDHVSPPQDGVPNPDGVLSPEGFNYDRLGVRIPTLVISPWVNKAIIHEPTGVSKTTPTSQYDATSIIASTNKIFGINPPLTTNRTAWAATFDSLLLERTTPRKDCPLVLPPVAPSAPAELERMRLRPLTDHEETSIRILCEINKRPLGCGQHIRKSEDMFAFVQREWNYYLEHAHELTSLHDSVDLTLAL